MNNTKREIIMKTIRSNVLLGIVLSTALFGAAAQAAPGAHDTAWYGVPVAVQKNVRTIVITPQTRHVNVTNGEVVTFAVGEQRFSFQFQTYPQTQVTELSAIAPAGIDVGAVRVYIADNPEGRG